MGSKGLSAVRAALDFTPGPPSPFALPFGLLQPLSWKYARRSAGPMASTSDLISQCMFRLATYPTSSRASLQSSCWTVTLYCQLLGIWLEVSPPIEALPSPVLKAGPALGGVRLSRKRPLGSVKLPTNGGFVPPICKAKRRSRLKNCPPPARMAHLPFPVGSQAKLRRGANM